MERGLDTEPLVFFFTYVVFVYFIVFLRKIMRLHSKCTL